MTTSKSIAEEIAALPEMPEKPNGYKADGLPWDLGQWVVLLSNYSLALVMASNARLALAVRLLEDAVEVECADEFDNCHDIRAALPRLKEGLQ